jgi:hypothetical protein
MVKKITVSSDNLIHAIRFEMRTCHARIVESSKQHNVVFPQSHSVYLFIFVNENVVNSWEDENGLTYVQIVR